MSVNIPSMAQKSEVMRLDMDMALFVCTSWQCWASHVRAQRSAPFGTFESRSPATCIRP